MHCAGNRVGGLVEALPLMWTLVGAQRSLAQHPSPSGPRLEGACKPGCWQLGKLAKEGLTPLKGAAMPTLGTLPEGE